MCAVAYRQVLTGIILAGGKASRMKGKDKAFLKIGKETLIEIQLRLLKKIFKKIIIVSNCPHKYKNLKGIEVISDVIANRGPLGGIYSGLLASGEDYNFLFACDMPYINLGLIKYMCKKAQGHDVVVPKINNRYEPLFGIYSRNCLKIIKESLDKKNFRIRKIFPKIKLSVISKKEILKFGLPQQLFMNINNQKELDLIQSDRWKRGFSCAE